MARGRRVVTFNELPVNLSQISRDTGISVTTLSRIIKGTRRPSLEKACAIAEALGMTLDVFNNSLPVRIPQNQP